MIDFNTISPHKDMVRCTLHDNSDVNHYFWESGYAEDGSDGQVMVEMLKFYYRTYIYGSKRLWSVSRDPKPGYKIHPAFIRNGVLKEKIYVGAFQASFYDVSEGEYADYYVGNATPYTDGDGDADDAPSGTVPDTTAGTGDKLASVAGRFPLTKLYRSHFRTLANNRGSNWTQLDFLTREATNLLYIVEFASLNGQTALGQGVCSKTWNSTYKAEKSGEATYSLTYPSYGITTDGLHPMCYRGIENWWGNVYQWCDGINIKADHNPWIADHDYADDKFESPYWDTGLTLATANGYISDVHNTPDWALLPSSIAGGGADKYFSDYYYQATGNRVARIGGTWDSSVILGPLVFSAGNSSVDAFIYVGGRLVCIP